MKKASGLEAEEKGVSRYDDFIAKFYLMRNSEPTKQIRIPLTTVAAVCRKTGVSSRPAAQMSCAVLKVWGIISFEDNFKAIDSCKTNRAIQISEKVIRIEVLHSRRCLKSVISDDRKDVPSV